MMAIPRKDGMFSFYVIQHFWPGKEDIESNWQISTDNERYFTAMEDCWQESGNTGTYDLERAVVALEDTKKRDEHKRTFRLVQIFTMRKTIVV
jgi:hypothetical protein